jgi:DNA-binding transcriptional regulator YbjK
MDLMSARAQRILDAAIGVVGIEGIRALTHRAVDAAAGLPAGSTSNLYRTRESLLYAMVGHMIDTEFEGWERLARTLQPTNTDELVEALVQLVRMLTGPLRALSVARYSLFMEAARDPALAAEIGRAADRVADLTTEWLGRIGFSDPQAHAPIVMAYLDGLIVHRLAFPPSSPQRDVAVELRTLLDGLMCGGDNRGKRRLGASA